MNEKKGSINRQKYDSITIDNDKSTNSIDNITINIAQSTIDLLGL